jgi:hypothetical protein
MNILQWRAGAEGKFVTVVVFQTILDIWDFGAEYTIVVENEW